MTSRNFSNVVRSITPPVITRWIKPFVTRGISFAGPVSDWAAACRQSIGYDDAVLIERVAAAARKVMDGRAAFERDGVTFSELEFRFPVLASLLLHAASNGGRLHVVDFGGALGSAYWQHRSWFAGLRDVRWIVVEQAAFVALGVSEFTGPIVGFAKHVADAQAQLDRPIILAGGVLQYLQHYEASLEQFESSSATALLIDRLPVSSKDLHEVCIQRVPKTIGTASYPCTIFSKRLLLERLQRHWMLKSELPCDEPPMRTTRGLPFEWRGFFLQRRSQ